MKTFFSGLLLSFITSTSVAAPNLEHYIFNYDQEHIYEVKLTDNTVTWKSLSGADKGQTETDNLSRKKLSDSVNVMQWVENDGTFITITFDKTNLKVISSGKFGTDTWLWQGTATQKIND